MMSTLRPTAKEFIPSWISTPSASQTCSQAATGASCGAAAGSMCAPPPPPPAKVTPEETPEAVAEGTTPQEGGDEAFWHEPQWQEMPMADALALLTCWFPSYAKPALQAIYEVNGKDMHNTLQDLCDLQAEATPADAPAAAQPPPPARPAAAARAAPAASDFPSLASAPNSSAPVRKPLSFASIVKNGPAAPPAAAAPSAPKAAAPAPSAAAMKKDVPWLATGDAVSAEYTTARENARDMARVRNACFQQATQAYLAGNKALAKELSEKGRRYNEEMKAEHEAASSAIFQARNRGIAGLTLQDNSGLIDLHGLHAAEACTLLDSLLIKHASRNRLLLCVGTGHHTKGSKTPARLSQAVEAHLTKKELSHRYLQPGLLEVQLKK